MNKMKKPIYKRVWVWIVAILLFFIIIGSSGSGANKKDSNNRDKFYELDKVVAKVTPGNKKISQSDYNNIPESGTTLEGLITSYGVPSHVNGSDDKGDIQMEVCFPTDKDEYSVDLIFEKKHSSFGEWLIKKKSIVETKGISLKKYKPKDNYKKSNTTQMDTSTGKKIYKPKKLLITDTSRSFLNLSKEDILKNLGEPNKIWNGQVSDKLLNYVVDAYKALYAINSVKDDKNEVTNNYKKIYNFGENLKRDSKDLELWQYNLFINKDTETPKSTFLVWIDKKSDKAIYQGDRALIDANGNYVDKR
ncbi:hypothetical protein [Melissococcus plutonius]|uniref:hypothetical protein n=1 Tax=Melissococcus plutonius TaxID=33970 RepID=UPI003C2F1730